MQPYFGVGHYTGFKELAEARTNNFTPYDFTDFDPDFNYKSYRANFVFRWEYLPGSLLYLVWTHDRANYADPGQMNLRRDFTSLFREAPRNIFFVKFSYMISII